MALPTAYTEPALAAYMRDELLETADVLGWTGPSNRAYTRAVRQTLRAYGVTTIAQATDSDKLETLARREVWRSVMHATAADYDTSDVASVTKRAQIHQHARAMFAQAEREASRYVVTLAAGTGGRSRAVTNEAVW